MERESRFSFMEKAEPVHKEKRETIDLSLLSSESVTDIEAFSELGKYTHGVDTAEWFRFYKKPLPEQLQEPPQILDCPIGFEPLLETAFILVESYMDTEDVLLGYDSDYRYEILNNDGDRIFFAGKVSKWGFKHLLWRSDSYDVHVMDSEGAGVFTVCCKASCCKDVLSVFVESGLLGTIISRCKSHPSLDVKDEYGKTLINIVMTNCPCCGCYAGGDNSFDIRVAQTGDAVGKIERLQAGGEGEDLIVKQGEEQYSMYFRKDLNVKVKVMLLAALLHSGFRFISTRYATLDRRIHADIVQEYDDDIVNKVAEEQSDEWQTDTGDSRPSVVPSVASFMQIKVLSDADSALSLVLSKDKVVAEAKAESDGIKKAHPIKVEPENSKNVPPVKVKEESEDSKKASPIKIKEEVESSKNAPQVKNSEVSKNIPKNSENSKNVPKNSENSKNIPKNSENSKNVPNNSKNSKNVPQANNSESNKDVPQSKNSVDNKNGPQAKNSESNNDVPQVKNSVDRKNVPKNSENSKNVPQVKNSETNKDVPQAKNSVDNKNVPQAKNSESNNDVPQVKNSVDNKKIPQVKNSVDNKKIPQVKNSENSKNVPKNSENSKNVPKNSENSKNVPQVKNSESNKNVPEANNSVDNKNVPQVKNSENSKNVTQLKDQLKDSEDSKNIPQLRPLHEVEAEVQKVNVKSKHQTNKQTGT